MELHPILLALEIECCGSAYDLVWECFYYTNAALSAKVDSDYFHGWGNPCRFVGACLLAAQEARCGMLAII